MASCLICPAPVKVRGQTCSEDCYLRMLDWMQAYMADGMFHWPDNFTVPLPLEEQAWLATREDTVTKYVEAIDFAVSKEQDADRDV